MSLNQHVVAVVMLSFELWFRGHKSSRGINLVVQGNALTWPFPVLEETWECFEKEKVFSWRSWKDRHTHCKKALCINRCVLKAWNGIWCNIVPLESPVVQRIVSCKVKHISCGTVYKVFWPHVVGEFFLLNIWCQSVLLRFMADRDQCMYWGTLNWGNGISKCEEWALSDWHEFWWNFHACLAAFTCLMQQKP